MAPGARFVVVALLAIVAGCASPSSSLPHEHPQQAISWQADCAIENRSSPPDGVCVRMFAPGSGAQLEPDVATSPLDSRSVAVTWTAREPGPVAAGGKGHVWAAVTSDGGVSWRTTLLEDPAAKLPLVDNFAFDSIAAYGPDGHVFVMYGGNDPRPADTAGPTNRITVAASNDNGTTWSYHRVTEGPQSQVWDYMDLAIAPDSGELYVLAQSAPDRGLFVWSSVDGAQTWSIPTPIVPKDAPNSAVAAFGRIAAGPQGLVMVEGYLPATGEGVFVSHDAGASFGAPVLVPGSTVAPAFTGPPIVGATIARLVYSTGSALNMVSSADAGKSWSSPVTVWTGVGQLRMAVGAVSSQGSVAAFASDEAKCGTAPWAAKIVSLNQSTTNLTLAAGNTAPPCSSNEYSGIAFGPDGTLWVSWSDPRESSTPRIAVAHLVRG